jgi:rhamnulose-1-phosphate aldolase
MMSDRILQSWFLQAMAKAATDLWLKGWHERNGGNVSLRLLDDDVAPYLEHLAKPRTVRISEAVPELEGQYFIVTGTGKFLRNVSLAPESCLGLLRVSSGGREVEILWGYSDGGGPTSELASHLKSHRSRQKVTGGRDRVVMHSHATNMIALSYVLDMSSAAFTRALWEMSTECLVVFPDGVGVLPWIVPGTDTIGDATAAAMHHHSLVLWPFHGVFATGPTLDDAFGLIDTAEKAATVLVKVIAMGGPRRSITTANLRDLAARFGVRPLASALETEKWM